MESPLRPEAKSTTAPAFPMCATWFAIASAVRKRRSLIHGQLHCGGHHCAMGSFWADNPGRVVQTSILEEVAKVNDSFPTLSAHERWKRVNTWLKQKIASL